MRTNKVIGIVPRYARWPLYSADKMLSYLFNDSGGANFLEVNGAADTADYSGTAPSFTGYGASLAGDGAAILPVAANSVFNLQAESRLVISAWIMTTDATMSNQDTVFCAGPDNSTAGNKPGVGHLRLQIANLSSNIRAQFVYRNASSDASAPSSQAVTFASNIGQASDTLHHLGLILHSDGTTVDYAMYLNGSALAAASLTVDGTKPIGINALAGQVAIGGSLTAAGTVKSSARFGENTDSQLHALMFWKKNGATESEAVNLITDCYKYRREASKYL